MHRALLVTVLMLLMPGCETLEQDAGGPGKQPKAGEPAKDARAGTTRPDAAPRTVHQEPKARVLRQDPDDASAAVARQPLPTPTSKPSGEPLVTAAIFHFEEGNYAKAEQLLRSSLVAGMASGVDRAQAHKYLAFIYCVTDRRAQCRAEFRRALKANSAFALTAAEAGHPTWGAEFRTVKGSR
jgi:hypothetical protein